MIELDPIQISGWISRYMYPFARIAGLLMVMPLIGSRMLNQRIRLSLALAITLAVVPILPPMTKVDALSLASLLIIMQQFVIGVVLGFAVEILMQVYVIAGQIIAMQTGLGIATTVDPSQGASVVVISQFFLFLVSLVFISLNGHLVLIEIVADSFHTLPVGFNGVQATSFSALVKWGSWMFAAALVLSLPAIVALLIVNLAFGVMTRAAPQLNIFALGFPVTMMVGLLIIWLNMSELAQSFQGLMGETFEFVKKLTLP